MQSEHCDLLICSYGLYVSVIVIGRQVDDRGRLACIYVTVNWFLELQLHFYIHRLVCWVRVLFHNLISPISFIARRAIANVSRDEIPFREIIYATIV